MHRHDLIVGEDLITRIGLVVAASYTLYLGTLEWGSAADSLHPLIVILELLTYLIAFVMLLAAGSGIGLRWVRHSIPALFIFALLIQAYLRMDGQPLTYGTDSAAFTHRAAELFIGGQNPYGQDLLSSLDEFRMPATFRTAMTDGSYQAQLPYPAYSFLAFVPFFLAGIQDVRVILLVFHVLVLILLYVAAPRWIKPLVLIPFFISPEVLAYTFGTVTDMVWVFYLTSAAVLWKKREASALLFGIAISTKQQAWFLLPFLVIRLWKETEDEPTSKRIDIVGRYLAVAELVFLAVNAPFFLSSPRAWFDGVVSPMFGPLIVFGQGLSTLSQIGALYAPRFYYTASALLVGAALVAIYWLNFRRMQHLLWVLPAIVLWFPYRSLQNYFIYWLPPLIVSLYPLLAQPANAYRAASRHPQDEQNAAGERRRIVLSAGIACATLIVVVGSGLFLQINSKPSLALQISRADLTADTNMIDQMDVLVSNDSASAVHPVFWVKQTGRPLFNWQVTQGPAVLGSGQRALYTIHSSFPDFDVANGSVIAVSANDSQNSSLAGFGSGLKVDLLSHASLLNADFFYWTLDPTSGSERPYGWGFYQLGNQGARKGQSAESELQGIKCMQLSVDQPSSNAQAEWLGSYLDQWTEFPDYKIRIPVYPTFRYSGGNSPSSVMGIEVRDDTHQLWYIFSDEPERLWTLDGNPLVAFHLLPAPLDQWSEPTVDIARDYDALHWSIPDLKTVVRDSRTVDEPMVNFRLFVGTRDQDPVHLSGCFGPIIQHLPQ